MDEEYDDEINERKLNINENVTKKVKVLCRVCRGVTKHKILTSSSEINNTLYHGNYTISWHNHHQIVECDGCEEISFRHEYYHSEETDARGRPTTTVSIFPYRNKDSLSTKNMPHIPYDLQGIYTETVNCFNYGSLVLCGAGCRAMVESFCIANDIVDGNLQSKIDSLHQKSIITEENANILHHLRFLGNDAIHIKSIPTRAELILAIEIMENIYNTCYVMPDNARRLARIRSGEGDDPFPF